MRKGKLNKSYVDKILHAQLAQCYFEMYKNHITIMIIIMIKRVDIYPLFFNI